MCEWRSERTAGSKTSVKGTVSRRKERQRVRIYALFLLMISYVICGCTRREQLVLEVESTAEAEGTEPDGLPDGGASDITALTAQIQDASEGSVVGGQGSNSPGKEASGQTEAGDVQQNGQEQSDAASVICVHVCGAVKNAGVYELPAGSRVFEAVEAAGGFISEADESYVNQAQRLTDGSKLVIPTIEQAQNATKDGETGTEQIGIVEQTAGEPDGYGVDAGQNSGIGEAGSATDGKININTASETQLCEIPGIGAARAAAIVAYRQESGGFHSIEDIMNVSGIKEGTYAKIKDSITVN